MTEPCPYERDANTPSIFYSVSDHREVQRCAQGQEFSDDKCTCLGPGKFKTLCDITLIQFVVDVVDDNGGDRHWRFTCDDFVDENHNAGVVEVVVFVDCDVVFYLYW